MEVEQGQSALLFLIKLPSRIQSQAGVMVKRDVLHGGDTASNGVDRPYHLLDAFKSVTGTSTV